MRPSCVETLSIWSVFWGHSSRSHRCSWWTCIPLLCLDPWAKARTLNGPKICTPPPPGQVADHFKVKLTNFACASIMNDPVGVRAVFVGGENNLDALAGCAPELLAGGLYVSCLFALSPPWTVYDPRFHTRTVISLGRRLSCRFLAGVVVWPFVSSSPSHSHCTFAEGLNEVRCCAPHAPVQEIHKCTPNPVHSSFTSHTRSATEKTDVFCFGLTAFEIVTGHKPVNATEALGGSNTELCMF